MLLQFLVFPPVARIYGVLNCLKVVTWFYPVAYIVTPFTVLMPTPLLQQIAIFLVMLIKCLAGVFAFPCTTILLTNSAGSLRLLGTLNGVATSISAIGRATGPSLTGGAFTYGVNVGYMIIPWWLLAVFAIVGHIPCYWLEEMDGFGGKDEDDGDDKDKNSQEAGSNVGQQQAPEINGLSSSSSPMGISRQGSSRKKSNTIVPIQEEREQEAQHAVPSEIPLSGAPPGSANRLERTNSSRSSRALGSSSSSGSSVSLIASPIGMVEGIGPRGKGRQMSNNLALSESLGRTMLGGGFGTRGPNIA